MDGFCCQFQWLRIPLIPGMDGEAIFFTGQGGAGRGGAGEGSKSGGWGGAGAGNILRVSTD